MNRFKKILSVAALHCVLLPAFVVIHACSQYFGLITFPDAFAVFFGLEFFVLLCFVLAFAFTRQAEKSAILATCFSAGIFFYGVIKDFFREYLGWAFIARYSVLIPLLIILFGLFCFWTLRPAPRKRFVLYVNVLLIIFVLFDLIMVFAGRVRTVNAISIANDTSLPAIPANAHYSKKPDIYYLVFDAYPGTAFLGEYMQYDNSRVDSFLINKGFKVLGFPRSNYNITACSIASTLNFSYLKGIRDQYRVELWDFNKAQATVRNSRVIRLMELRGYQVYNYSIFELGNQAPLEKETFFSVSSRQALLYNTLPQRLYTDLGYLVLTDRYHPKLFAFFKDFLRETTLAAQLKKKHFNNRIIDSLPRITAQTSARPRFIYIHLYLPHPPHFYTADGKERDSSLIVNRQDFLNRESFLAYLQYTNKVLSQMVDSIMQQQNGPPVILLQSDHGSIEHDGCPQLPELDFRNYAAYYFPDHDYSLLNDSMTNVNSFPIILNKYFGADIPLKKDSLFYLH